MFAVVVLVPVLGYAEAYSSTVRAVLEGMWGILKEL
jgi:hypothetical protein